MTDSGRRPEPGAAVGQPAPGSAGGSAGGPEGETGRRCPSCGALVAGDAAWCGQCFADLRQPAPPEAEPAARAGPAGSRAAAGPTGVASERRPAFWPCPVCGGENPIDADACTTCGTPFAALMREEPERPTVDPRDALAWSLMFPGLGHRKLGFALDGLARGVLFGVAFAMALLVGFAGVRSGPTFGVFALFLLTALAVYVMSAFEAYRIAQGGTQLVSSRALLWVLVVVILASVVMLALAVATAAKG